MKAHLIAIGTELLLGDVINSNAAWLSEQLARAGIDVYFHSTVGDNPQRIKAIVKGALTPENPQDAPDVLIFTGGLGPTEDDLTIATLADLFDSSMMVDVESAAKIEAFFKQVNRPMVSSNLKQAQRPESAQVIDNPLGTAPGIFWDISQYTQRLCCLMTFPGVPREMKAMFPQGLAYMEAFKQQYGFQTGLAIVKQSLHFFGIGESQLAEQLADFMGNANPTVAPYVGQGQVRIRLTAKAASQAEAQKLIEPVKQQIIQRAREYYIGDGEAQLEQMVASRLTTLHKSLAVAESCTGGLISQRLTSLPGSSAYTRLNVVTYANDQKSKVLGVSAEVLDSQGAVSEAVAAQMATGMLALSGCDLALSITGIAGPGGASPDNPVGLAYIGLAQRDHPVKVFRIQAIPKLNRQDIQFWFSQSALFSVLKALED
jgi:nicotinamide-nucleotide amidase